MRLLKRTLQIIALGLITAMVVGGSVGYWFITKSHPQIEGTLQVKGVQARVEIVRDTMGIPHIYAANQDDLFFAQGYVQAQDRLWQMDYNRHIGRGTLSEMFGAATIKEDRFLRTMGLARAARLDLAALTADETRVLDAYARGVNAFIETHRDNLPIEYTILGITPAPWVPLDTLVWAKVMAYNLGGNYDAELLRQSLIEKFGEAKARELMLPYPAAGPFIIPPEAKEFTTHNRQFTTDGSEWRMANGEFNSIGNPDLNALADLHATLGMRGPEIGSNDWVIDGTKSTTGKPILASDQHLGIQMPSVWYQVGLHCAPQNDACPYNVAGVTFPGVPGVVVGHNDRIAWGVTNVGPDVQDLFIEEFNPQNPNQSKFNGKWEDIHIAEEPIKVKNVISETLKVQVTRHGPIMTPVLAGVTKPVALQWTALRERSHVLGSVLMINRAKNWEQFRAALKLWDAPSQNFVYADVDGNIGYQMPGNVPIRTKGTGAVPVSGAGEYEWTGYIPFDELPFVFNPPTHFIATANNAVVPPSYKYWITQDWSAPYRQQRIVDLLNAKDKLSVNDIAAIQADVYSIPLAQLQKYVSALKPEGFLQERAMEYVKKWDGRLTTDNIGGTIVEVTYQRLARNLYGPKFGDDQLLRAYLGTGDDSRRATLSLLDNPKSDWWGATGRDELVKKSFAEAVDYLGSQYGDAPVEWRWGRLHTATFNHPLGSVQPLDRIFNAGPIGVPGGVNTVFATSLRSNAPYASRSITSQRQIIDVMNFDNSVHVDTTGQSGQAFHKHFSDQVLLWRDVRYTTFAFTRAAVEKSREGALVLLPSPIAP
ncbi:MAG: penicillin acylase family protein [Chloroflexi bacterium]|nr:penicillin acylase family protein [Chloroflexota bacterium]